MAVSPRFDGIQVSGSLVLLIESLLGRTATRAGRSEGHIESSDRWAPLLHDGFVLWAGHRDDLISKRSLLLYDVVHAEQTRRLRRDQRPQDRLALHQRRAAGVAA